MDRSVRSARLALVDGGRRLEGHEAPIPHRGPHAGSFWPDVYRGGDRVDVSGASGALHLLYIIFFLLLGGLIGEYVLRNRVWRWFALFVPLATGMFLMQIDDYPASAHVEWPGRATSNPWGAAFLWIRHNTPKDAIFALNPNYMLSSGEEMHGFRAVAERSVLADAVKDSGAVSLFPGLAERWQAQVQAMRGWDGFQLADFERVA